MKSLSQKSRLFNFIFLQMKFLSRKPLQFEIVRNTVTIRIYESLPGKVNKSAKVPFQPLSSSSLISLFAERKRFENKKKVTLAKHFLSLQDGQSQDSSTNIIISF